MGLLAGSTGVPMSIGVSKQTGPNGAIWADVTQFTMLAIIYFIPRFPLGFA